MPFVKDTSYCEMPFSSESPSPEDFHCFMSVKQLIERIKYHRNTYRCRTVGVVAGDYGRVVIHELDDQMVQIRLSLAHSSRLPPFGAKPYTAQLFGCIYWKDGVGPVITPYVILTTPVPVAIRLRETMEWLNRTHIADRRQLDTRGA